MQKVTIKDIAVATNISQGTVHRALTGKKGVSDEVRKKIITAAKEMGYTPNYLASALKRKPITILIYLPKNTHINTYYNNLVEIGIDVATDEFKDYNINFNILYYDESEYCAYEKLKKYITRSVIDICGIIIVPFENEDSNKSLDSITKQIPTVFIGQNLENVEKLCFVSADYSVAANLLLEIVGDNSQILIIGTTEDSRYNTIFSVLNQRSKLIPVFVEEEEAEKLNKIKKYLVEDNEINAVFSLGCYNTVLLGRVIRSIDCNRSIKVIGSDFFDETITMLERDICNYLINTNVLQQAKTSAKILVDFIIKNKKPSKNIVYVNVDVIFKSNLKNVYK